MLRDNLDSEVVLLDVNIGIVANSLHQSTLNLGTRVVGMMQDAKLRVSALTMQVEVTIFLTVEVNPPPRQFLNLLRSHTHHLLNGFAVADEVASNNGIGNMLVEGIQLQIGH